MVSISYITFVVAADGAVLLRLHNHAGALRVKALRLESFADELKGLFEGLSCRINDLKADVHQLRVHIAVRRSHCGPWCIDLSTYLSLIVNPELER